jgi:superfamily II DNA or RNA helicase
MSFQPRAYQLTTNEALIASWNAGKKAPLIVAPTGAGKTEIAKMAMAPFHAPMGLVHTETLFEQTLRRCPNVRVYTIQSLIAKGTAADRRRALLSRHDVCWVDEAHHIAAGSWSQVRRLLDEVNPTIKLFGVTATPKRADGTPLGDCFDDLIVAAKYSDLVKDGYLCKCDVARSDISRKDQKDQKVRPDGVDAYLKHGRMAPEDPRRAQGQEWRPGIHFEVTIEACEAAVQRYNEVGVRAALVCANTPTQERKVIFQRYTAGELEMLCSPTALAEGFDSPRAEVCVLRRSVDHVGDYMQRCGRVLRPFPGKERALIIDITNASTKHGLPTNDRLYSLDGKGIRNVPTQEELDEEAEKAVRAPVPYSDIESRFTMIRDTLLSRYRDLQATAAEFGYKQGWIWHRFTEATSVSPPRVFKSQYASVCVHCRHRVAKDSDIFWDGTKQVYHEECWFNALDGQKLDKASVALEQATEWKPSVSRRPVSSIHGDDDIPF